MTEMVLRDHLIGIFMTQLIQCATVDTCSPSAIIYCGLQTPHYTPHKCSGIKRSTRQGVLHALCRLEEGHLLRFVMTRSRSTAQKPAALKPVVLDDRLSPLERSPHEQYRPRPYPTEPIAAPPLADLRAKLFERIRCCLCHIRHPVQADSHCMPAAGWRRMRLHQAVGSSPEPPHTSWLRRRSSRRDGWESSS